MVSPIKRARVHVAQVLQRVFGVWQWLVGFLVAWNKRGKAKIGD